MATFHEHGNAITAHTQALSRPRKGQAAPRTCTSHAVYMRLQSVSARWPLPPAMASQRPLREKATR